MLITAAHTYIPPILQYPPPPPRGCHLKPDKKYLYVHILWQRRAAGSKSANEDPELFDKLFITGLWNANLTAKNKIIQLGFYYVSVNFHVDFTLRESSPFAFNIKPLFSFFDRAELFSAIDVTYHVPCYGFQAVYSRIGYVNQRAWV